MSGTPAPSSNRTCSFPAYGSPCETGVIGLDPLCFPAPFHIDSNGCSSIWTSGFRRTAAWRVVPYYSLSTLFFSPFDLHRPFFHAEALRSTGVAPLPRYYDLIRLLHSLSLIAVLPSSLAELSGSAAPFAPPRPPCPNRVSKAMLASRPQRR